MQISTDSLFSISENDVFCRSVGLDLCTYPISANTTLDFYIYITCTSDECSFFFKATYEKLRTLSLTTPKFLNFDTSGSKVLLLSIPSEYSSLNYKRLIIQAFLLNPEEIEEPFGLYINKGNKIPTAETH